MSDSAPEPQRTPQSKRTDHPSGGASPAARLVSALDGQYYLLSEVAEILGKSQMTIRRAMYNKRVKAPSLELNQGKMKIYLYTTDDIQELRDYYAPQVTEREND